MVCSSAGDLDAANELRQHLHGFVMAAHLNVGVFIVAFPIASWSALPGGFLEFGLALADGERVSRKLARVIVRHQLEAILQQRLQHLLGSGGSRSGGDFCEDVETAGIKPTWPALHTVPLHAVSRGDQIEQGGVLDLVALAADDRAAHTGVGDLSARVDIGGFERGVRCRLGDRLLGGRNARQSGQEN